MEQAKEKLREARIQQWFSMWLDKCDTGIETLFAPDAIYVESWGPEYHGSEKIKPWFEEWNTRGMVQRWDIRQYFHKENHLSVLTSQPELADKPVKNRALTAAELLQAAARQQGISLKLMKKQKG